MSTQETINWGIVISLCGPVYRAAYKGCNLETDPERTWLHITHDNHDGETVIFKIVDGICEFENCTGSDWTASWTDEDWTEIEDSLITQGKL